MAGMLHQQPQHGNVHVLRGPRAVGAACHPAGGELTILPMVNALGPAQWLACCTNNRSMGMCMRCAARVLWALHVILPEVSSWRPSSDRCTS